MHTAYQHWYYAKGALPYCNPRGEHARPLAAVYRSSACKSLLLSDFREGPINHNSASALDVRAPGHGSQYYYQSWPPSLGRANSKSMMQ